MDNKELSAMTICSLCPVELSPTNTTGLCRRHYFRLWSRKKYAANIAKGLRSDGKSFTSPPGSGMRLRGRKADVPLPPPKPPRVYKTKSAYYQTCKRITKAIHATTQGDFEEIKNKSADVYQLWKKYPRKSNP